MELHIFTDAYMGLDEKVDISFNGEIFYRWIDSARLFPVYALINLGCLFIRVSTYHCLFLSFLSFSISCSLLLFLSDILPSPRLSSTFHCSPLIHLHDVAHFYLMFLHLNLILNLNSQQIIIVIIIKSLSLSVCPCLYVCVIVCMSGSVSLSVCLCLRHCLCSASCRRSPGVRGAPRRPGARQRTHPLRAGLHCN